MIVPLSTKLAELGHQVDLVCLDRPTGSDHERLAKQTLRESGVSWRSLGRRLGKPGFMAAAKLWWLAQFGGYDVIHSHLPLADMITGFVRHISPARFKHVMTVHSSGKAVNPGITALCSSGASVVYVSEAARRINPSGGVIDKVIPNGINLDYYRAPSSARIETRKSLGLADSTTAIIAVGRICVEKNYDCAIRGIAELKRQAPDLDVRYLICGDGPGKQRLKALAADLQLNGWIQFCESRTDIPELLAAGDIFLSTSSVEGMPLSVLEALTSGLPCVLSGIEQHYEIAQNMPGCVFTTPNSAEEVSHALLLFLKDPMSPSELRLSREPRLDKFSIRACATSYSNFYASLRASRHKLGASSSAQPRKSNEYQGASDRKIQPPVFLTRKGGFYDKGK
jgi:glycosyltransferase involved in cell wall biosynthesis